MDNNSKKQNSNNDGELSNAINKNVEKSTVFLQSNENVSNDTVIPSQNDNCFCSQDGNKLDDNTQQKNNSVDLSTTTIVIDSDVNIDEGFSVDYNPKKTSKIGELFSYLKWKSRLNVSVSNGQVTLSKSLAITLVCVLIASLILACVGIGLTLTNNNNPSYVYNKVEKAVVALHCYNAKGENVAVGSGFFVSSDGVVATCYHVIENCVGIRVVTNDNDALEVVSIIGFDKEKDVAFLKVDKKNCQYLKYSDKKVNIGDKIYALGAPQGYENTFSEGIVSSFRLNNDKPYIQFTAPISQGNSGCPLLDTNGDVIGMVASRNNDGENIAFALKSEFVQSVSIDKNMTILEFLIENATNIGSKLLYALEDDGTLTVVGVSNNIADSYVSIPSTYNGYRIKKVEITPSYSKYLSNVIHISFSEGIESLDNNCFVNATKLTSLSLPKSMTNISIDAFNCENLTKIYFPNGSDNFIIEDEIMYNVEKTVLYKYSIYNNSEEFTVPSTVEVISSGAFSQNRYLKTVYLSYFLQRIGTADTSGVEYTGAFEYCQNLQNVYFRIGSKPVIIGNDTFRRCLSFDTISLPDSVAIIGDYAFYNSGLINLEYLGKKLPLLGKNVVAPKIDIYTTQSSFDNALKRGDLALYEFVYHVVKNDVDEK